MSENLDFTDKQLETLRSLILPLHKKIDKALARYDAVADHLLNLNETVVKSDTYETVPLRVRENLEQSREVLLLAHKR